MDGFEYTIMEQRIMTLIAALVVAIVGVVMKILKSKARYVHALHLLLLEERCKKTTHYTKQPGS